MEKKSIWGECTNLYSLQKTLRFELKPVGKTIEHIKNASLIEDDEQRAKDFQEVKKIIDKYHQHFIEKALREVSFSKEELTAFKDAYDGVKKDKTDNDARKKLAEQQKKLRNSLRKKLETIKEFKHLFDKELIRKIVPDWDGLSEDQRKLIGKFKKWTTYFKGFNENRENVYSKEEISTSLIFRIIHDNFPKFLDNIDRFKKLREEHSVDFSKVEQELNDILNGMNLLGFFSLENFNNCLNQSGIEKFNIVLGGKTFENGEKIKGINEYVNERSQNAGDKEKSKAIRKLKLLPLFKQILSERVSSSFAYEPIENDEQALSAVTSCYQQFAEQESRLRDLLGRLQEYDLKSIYVKSSGLSEISKQLYGEWNTIGEALDSFAKSVFPLKNPEKPLQKELKQIEAWKKAKYQSLHDIEKALCLQEKGKNDICKYFSSLKKKTESEEVSLFETIKRTHDDASVVLSSTKYSKTKKDLCKQENEQDVAKIKALLDALLECYRFVKHLHVGSKNDKDSETSSDVVDVEGDFYGAFNEVFEKLESVVSVYNKVRNHVTQKPFETKKFKLNFANSTLLEGWDKNKEKDNSCVLFLKDGKYFLGVMNKDHKKIFENIRRMPESDYYAKMEYKQIADASKDIQNLMVINGKTVCKKGRKNAEGVNQQLEELKNIHLPRNINEIRKRKSYLKSSELFDRNDCIAFIDYYKERLKYFPFDFNLKPSDQYEDFNEFVEDVGSQGYRIDFKNRISSDYINSLVEEGKLYLFQIYSKDFSLYSKGRKNLNTLYWIELFTPENLKDAVYKLNGKAELFYRKKSIKQWITHPKNTPIGNKDPIEGKKTSTFDYGLIKDKRYTEDKFLFHCPISLNFKAKGRSNVNEMVNDTIAKNTDNVGILSIDRGERHLAYYTLLDSKGKILDQGSFNSVTNFMKNTRREVDYRKKLNELEGKRDDARKNWKKIENIKELKEGYLSQIVHTIVKIATENNAIIVLEDLNFGFKRGRFRIEKQVYQKLEKKLIDKLNYLVFKDREKGAAGGLRKAYQLVSPFKSFKKMGKQTGIIYYVPAHYTSKMCPRTGFINLLYPKYESKEKAKSFFGKFERIAYNKEKEYFEFTFSYKKHGVEKLKKDVWTVCSRGTRLETFRNPEKNNNFDDRERNVTEELKTLFSNANIDYSSVENIREQIISIDSEDFFRKLTELLKLTLKMRNSRTGNDEDYFLSCVSESNGEFFDSRKAKEYEPKNADANGAYNIGVKGLMVVNEIRKSEGEKKLSLKISKEQFFNFAVLHKQTERLGENGIKHHHLEHQ